MPLKLLVERAAPRAVCGRRRDGRWERVPSWTADGSAFLELESEPRRLEIVRFSNDNEDSDGSGDSGGLEGSETP